MLCFNKVTRGTFQNATVKPCSYWANATFILLDFILKRSKLFAMCKTYRFISKTLFNRQRADDAVCFFW